MLDRKIIEIECSVCRSQVKCLENSVMDRTKKCNGCFSKENKINPPLTDHK